MVPDKNDLLLWRAGQGFALLFLALLVPFHPYPGSFVIKALPCLALAALVLRNRRDRSAKLFVAGLLLSACGDVALDLDRERYFIVGLGAFLVAHLLYIAAFLYSFGPTRARLPWVVLILAYGLVVGWLLRDIPGDKLVPVMIYLGAITAMVISTVCVSPLSPHLIAGAIFFMLSDSIIAINKFLYPIFLSTLFNIGLYFLAQFTLVRGFLGKRGRSGFKHTRR